jgi:hypothetical protein
MAHLALIGALVWRQPGHPNLSRLGAAG